MTKRLLQKIISMALIVFILINSNGFECTQIMATNSSETTQTSEIYTGEDYLVSINIMGCWEDGYNANVRIENTGSKDIDNWSLLIEYDGEISNIWNAKIESSQEGSYLIVNSSWNQDILAGSYVEFGYISNSAFESFPISCELMSQKQEQDINDYSIEYIVNSDWNSGFSSQMVIKNNSNETIEDWVLEFDYNREIENIWNGIIESHSDNHYVIKNTGSNSNIYPNSEVSFGFLGKSGNSSDEPYNYCLYDYSRREKKACESDVNVPESDENTDDTDINDELSGIITVFCKDLSCDEEYYIIPEDFNGFCGKLERADEVESFNVTVYDKGSNVVYFSEIDPIEEWCIENIAIIYGENTVEFKACIDDEIEKRIIKVRALKNVNFDNLVLDESDEDEDGLINYFEMYFGTDPYKKDTDEDGLDDFTELYILGTNATKKDSDDNGIEDGEEDADGDTLNNLSEISLGTNPVSYDTDGDGLSDSEEINYGLSPILIDTDSNGVSDYEELLLSEKNVVYCEETDTYTATFSAEEMMDYYDENVVPKIILNADKQGILTFEMDIHDSDMMVNPSMEGYLGAAYDFHTSGEMDSAELIFTYNDSITKTDNFLPTIYWYDTDNDELIEVENQKWEDNQVSATLTHFSTYILLNKYVINYFWSNRIDFQDDTVPKDIYFVVDLSRSMTRNDWRAEYCAGLISSIVAKMGVNDRIGLIGSSKYYAYLVNFLDSPHDKIYEDLEWLRDYVPDGADCYYGMKMGVETTTDLMLEQGRPEAQKYIICISGNYSLTMDKKVLEKIKSNGIILSYIEILGSYMSSNDEYNRPTCESTGGKFYSFTYENFAEAYKTIASGLFNDKNNDNLDDYITKLICQGKITTKTGSKVFCSNEDEDDWLDTYNAIMEGSDYDNDGIVNGDEIRVITVNGRLCIEMFSNPELADTDFDGYPDSFIKDENEVLLKNDEYSVYLNDYEYLNNDLSVSDWMYSEYLGRSNFAITSEFLFNAILCGGQRDMARLSRKQLLNLLVDYAEANSDFSRLSSYVDTFNNVLRGLYDFSYIDSQIKRNDLLKCINMCQNEIHLNLLTKGSLFEAEDASRVFKQLQKELKAQNINLQKYMNKFEGVCKGINYLSLAVNEFTDVCEYNASLNLVSSYEDILWKLFQCDNENVREAAGQLHSDITSLYSRSFTIAGDVIEDLLAYGQTASIGSFLANLGIGGIIADLALLAVDIGVGDKIDNKLINVVNVDNVNGIYSATEVYTSMGKYDNDYLIFEGKYKKENVMRLFPFYVFSKLWTENECKKMYGDKYKERFDESIYRLEKMYNRYRVATLQ